MAAPFGPPPSLATTWTLPSGVTRDSVRRSISTRTTEPSGIATGPSGKRRPDASCLNAGVVVAIASPFGRAGAGSLDRRTVLAQDLTPLGPRPASARCEEEPVMATTARAAIPRYDVVGSLLRPAYLRDARQEARG